MYPKITICYGRKKHQLKYIQQMLANIFDASKD